MRSFPSFLPSRKGALCTSCRIWRSCHFSSSLTRSLHRRKAFRLLCHLFLSPRSRYPVLLILSIQFSAESLAPPNKCGPAARAAAFSFSLLSFPRRSCDCISRRCQADRSDKMPSCYTAIFGKFQSTYAHFAEACQQVDLFCRKYYRLLIFLPSCHAGENKTKSALWSLYIPRSTGS